MYRFVRPYTAGLAAASVGILTLSLVTAPPDNTVTIARADGHTVQLATLESVISDVPRAVTTSTTIANTSAADLNTALTTAATAPTSFEDALSAIADELVDKARIFAFSVGAGSITAVLIAAAFVWNGVANVVNPVLGALGQPRLNTLPVCFFGGINCGSGLTAQAQPEPTAAVAAGPAGDLADTTNRPAGHESSSKPAPAPTTRTKPTVAVDNDDDATDVGAGIKTPSRAAWKLADSRPDKKAATLPGATHRTNSSKESKAVGTGKHAKKATAHSTAANTTKQADRHARSKR